MKKSIIFFLSVAILASCNKEIIKPIDPTTPNPDSSFLKLIWQTFLTDGKEYIPPIKPPAIFGGKVAFNRLTDEGDPHNVVVCFDAQTGEKKWGFEDPIDISEGSFVSDLQGAGNNLALCSSHEMYWIDANSGQYLWKTDAQNDNGSGMPRMEVLNKKIYHTRYRLTTGNCCERANSHLVAAPIETGKWDTLYSVYLDQNEGYDSAFESYAIWQNPQTGDSILLFQNRQYNWDICANGIECGRLDVLAFNLKTRKVEWKTRINDPIGNASIKNMLVHDDKVYFLGQTLFSCLNLFDGSIIWQKEFNKPLPPGAFETLLFAGMAIADGKLLLKPDNENFYALDPNTGGEIWKRTDAGHSPGHLEIHKDLAIYASTGLGDIWIHRVSDGKLLEKFSTPHKKDPKFPGAAIAYSMAIDPKTGLLYTSDGYFAMCFRIER